MFHLFSFINVLFLFFSHKVLSGDPLGGVGGGVNLDICVGKEDPTTFFNDGARKIDFVLVFEETKDGTDEFDLTTQPLAAELDTELTK